MVSTLLLGFLMNAQGVRFEHYNESNGLSQNSVRHILQDSTGFLWLGTFRGLNRFDGYQFKPFLSSDYNINNDDITALELSKNGEDLWIGTRKGLTKLHIPTQTFTSFLPNSNDPNSLPDPEIRAIYIDAFNHVWLGTKSKGVVIYDPEENSFSALPIDKYSYVKTIYQDSNGFIWIGSYGTVGVARITVDSRGKPINIETYGLDIPDSESKNPYSYFFFEDQKNDFFIGTRDGLFKWNKDIRKFDHLPLPDEDFAKSIGPYFVCIAQAPTGEYWLGTIGGILVCDHLEDISLGKFKRYQFKDFNKHALIDDFVSSLFFDQNNVLWIGTENGLDKFDPYENQFELVNRIDDSAREKILKVSGFEKAHDGKLIIAYRNFGLYTFSKTEGTQELLKVEEEISSIKSFDGVTFYCGLWNGHVLIYNYKTNMVKTIDVAQAESPIFSFYQLPKDEILISSYGSGSIILDKEGNKVANQKLEAIKDYRIDKMAQDSNGLFWIASSIGVVKYDIGQDKVIQVYDNKVNDSIGFANAEISDILIDREQQIWCTNRSGLYKFNTKFQNFVQQDIADLKNVWITDILESREGKLWLNLNSNEVAEYDKKTRTSTLYHIDTGYKLDFFSFRGFFIHNNSDIYLGAKDGFVRFPLNDKKTLQAPTKPFISDLYVNNKKTNIGDLIGNGIYYDTDLNHSKHIQIPYDKRNFSLTFSVPSYSEELFNKYQYKLEGYDDDWNTVDVTRRTAHYTNLFFGDYVFLLKASNSQGAWSEVVSYNIKILPPIWLSPIAIFIYLLLFTLVIFIVTQIRKKQSALKTELLLEKVKREKEERINEEKLKLFTNISHELRNPLSLIIGPAGQLVEEGFGSEKHQTKYNLIFQNAKKLMGMVNQILDFRKAEGGKLKLKVAKTPIISHTKNLYNSFLPLALEKKIKMNFIHDQEKIEGWVDTDKYAKIVNNLLSNAIKFTKRNGKIDLFLDSKGEEEPYLVLEVADNGIGIQKEEHDKIFSRFYQVKEAVNENNSIGTGIGLSLVKSLVEIHKAKLELTSEPNKGSAFKVIFPIHKSAYAPHEIFDLNLNEKSYGTPQEISIPNAADVPAEQDQRPKVLIIDDNEELRNYIAGCLGDHFDTYQAKNGEDGLVKCRSLQPTLCVCDVMMPKMDGFEFCESLKQDDTISHIPIIMLTALSQVENKIKGYKLGADDYLAKPFDPSLLKIRIDNIIKNRSKLKARFSKSTEVELESITHSPADEEFLAKVNQLIEDNLNSEKLTPAFIAEEMATSSSTLYRKIKELTDIGPNEFIRVIRLKKAVTLLRTRRHNVSEVSYLVGFNDPLYFSKCFKQQFGFSPSKLDETKKVT